MNIALIGLGMVSATHLTAIRSSDQNLKLYGVLGRDPARTAAFAVENRTRAYASVAEIAGDSAIDFVILATPPDARREIVEILVAAKKPILMEKPVERDFAAATEIVKICETASVPLGIVFQHRAREASVELKSAIEAGTLGEISTVDLRVPWWRNQNYYDAPGRGTYARDGGGVMISQAIHTLDLAMWLLGPITSVQAMMRRTKLHMLEAEDWAGALFEMQCGAIGSLIATTASYPGHAETITIQGTKASAHLGSGVLTIQYFSGEIKVFGTAGATGGGSDPMAFTHAWHQSVIEDFASSLAKNQPPMTPGWSALRSHALIDAMETANRSGQRVEVSLCH